MRIALTDSFPNIPFSAEREFAQRFIDVAARAGHTAAEVITSDDIYDFGPDFVICLHETTPKLTPFPTFGAMWSPPEFSKDIPYRVRSMRSYDAYLVGSEEVRLYLEDLEFASRVTKPKSDFYFLPVAQQRPFVDRRHRSLAYLGVHWDGWRHAEVLDKLIEGEAITIYGPERSWSRLTSCYGGQVPFDGAAVFETLSAHGIALCLHKDEHRRADTPSLRLFEAAAAGCVIISDEMPFAKRVLGDAALYVDLRMPSLLVAQTIADHVNWITANPDAASAKARRAHEIISREYCLESLVQKTCDFAEAVARTTQEKRALVRGHYLGEIHEPRRLNGSAASSSVENGGSPIVDVIVRCGSRPLDYVKRAIASLERQTVGPLRALLVDYNERADIEAFATDNECKNVRLTYLQSPNNGLRSTALWAGLARVTAPFFAILDDDDELMPDHFCGLLYSSIKNPKSSLIYCGAIRRQEDRGHYHSADNFAPAPGFAARVIHETRELKFLDEFNLGRLAKLDNFILSNAWVCRSELLDDELLLDPKLEFAEDMYLLVFLASRGKFACSHQATAFWNWRSAARDNSMFELQTDAWLSRYGKRILLRLQDARFEQGVTLGELHDQMGTPAAAPDVSKIVYAARTDSAAPAKKKRGPLQKLLHAVPIYQTYREVRKQRRRERRERAQLNGHAPRV